MSKVVKASRLNMTFPTTLNPEDFCFAVSQEIAAAVMEEEKVPIGPSAAEEAEAIMKETEAMVRELLTAGKKQAEQTIFEARQQAEEILAQAKQQQENWQLEASQQGYQGGYQEGKAVAQAEYEALIAQAKETVDQALAEKRKILAASEGEILQLVLVIAKKVIGLELTTNPEIIKNLVQTALTKVCDTDNVSVKVNPAEISDILDFQDELKKSSNIPSLQVLGDETITRGGCLIETSYGNVDGRLERRIEEVEEALWEVKSIE